MYKANLTLWTVLAIIFFSVIYATSWYFRQAATPQELARQPDDYTKDTIGTTTSSNMALSKILYDSEYGLRLRYPASFQQQQTGLMGSNGLWIYSEQGGPFPSSEDFWLQLLSPEWIESDSPISLESFQQGSSVAYGTNSILITSPLHNVVEILPSGVSLLTQTYSQHLYASDGTDITEESCDFCRNARRYVAFNKTGVYYVINAGIHNDPILEKRIINTIEF